MNIDPIRDVAGLAAALALLASPALAQMHGGHMGGSGHMGGFTGARSSGSAIRSGGRGFHAPMTGFRSSANGTWRGGFDPDHDGDFDGHRPFFFGGCCGFFGGGFGWWGDPFWGGGYYPAYDVYDDIYDYGPPGPPPGYDCDGWRWDPNQRRYVPAMVSCD